MLSEQKLKKIEYVLQQEAPDLIDTFREMADSEEILREWIFILEFTPEYDLLRSQLTSILNEPEETKLISSDFLDQFLKFSTPQQGKSIAEIIDELCKLMTTYKQFELLELMLRVKEANITNRIFLHKDLQGLIKSSTSDYFIMDALEVIAQLLIEPRVIDQAADEKPKHTSVEFVGTQSEEQNRVQRETILEIFHGAEIAAKLLVPLIDNLERHQPKNDIALFICHQYQLIVSAFIQAQDILDPIMALQMILDPIIDFNKILDTDANSLDADVISLFKKHSSDILTFDNMTSDISQRSEMILGKHKPKQKAPQAGLFAHQKLIAEATENSELKRSAHYSLQQDHKFRY